MAFSFFFVIFQSDGACAFTDLLITFTRLTIDCASLTIHFVWGHEEVFRAQIENAFLRFRTRILRDHVTRRAQKFVERVVFQVVAHDATLVGFAIQPTACERIVNIRIDWRLQRSCLSLLILSISANEGFDLAFIAFKVNLPWKFCSRNLLWTRERQRNIKI